MLYNTNKGKLLKDNCNVDYEYKENTCRCICRAVGIRALKFRSSPLKLKSPNPNSTGITLVAILVVFVTMPYHSYGNRRFPVSFRKFGNVAIFSVMVTCIIYVLVYGKTLDWYSDPTIVFSTISAVVSGLIFIYMEYNGSSPYFLMEIFRLKTIWMGIALFALLMVFNSSAMLVSIFTGVGMKIDNWQNAALNNWCIAGYVAGAIIAVVQ